MHNRELKEAAFDDITARIEWNLPFVKPLIRTSKTFVWKIIRQFGLELIESYSYVHHSLECNCGAQAKKGELKELKRWQREVAKGIATDLEILSEQFGGKHKVTDEYGRTYIRDFGTWGVPPKRQYRKLRKDQKQLIQYLAGLENLACWDCSAK
jgi:hypothetical protein